MPQDVKISPDGKVFYVADMMSNGVFMIDGENMKLLGFLPTGTRRARLVSQPRLTFALCFEPGHDRASEGRQHLSDRFRDAIGGSNLAHSGRRQSRYGRGFRRMARSCGFPGATRRRFTRSTS